MLHLSLDGAVYFKKNQTTNHRGREVIIRGLILGAKLAYFWKLYNLRRSQSAITWPKKATKIKLICEKY
jgi:hypothetical protein